jgi:hypothetical protein
VDGGAAGSAGASGTTDGSLGGAGEVISEGSGGIAAAGSDGTSAAGSDGASAAGSDGTSAAGSDGTSAAGSDGTSAAGSDGTSAAGSDGTSAAGSDGTSAAGSNGIAPGGAGGVTGDGVAGTGEGATDGEGGQLGCTGEPSNFAVDDGTWESNYTQASEALWLNRFTPVAFPFDVNTVSTVYTPEATAGDDIEVVLWEDTDGDGDPGTGAVLRHTEYFQIESVDGETWDHYALAELVRFEGPGDILVGLVNRSADPDPEALHFVVGALDTTAPQQRSWFGTNAMLPLPDPPVIPTGGTWALTDAAILPSNWMIRAEGHVCLDDGSTGGSAGAGGQSSGGAAGVGAGGDGGAGDAAACNDIDVTDAPAVTPTIVTDTAPEPLGGTIQDGTYYLTSAVVYVPSGDAPPTAPTREIMVISCAGGGGPCTTELALERGSNPVQNRTTTWPVPTGSTMSGTVVCPPDGGSGTASFTATGTELVLFNTGGGNVTVATLTRQ